MLDEDAERAAWALDPRRAEWAAHGFPDWVSAAEHLTSRRSPAEAVWACAEDGPAWQAAGVNAAAASGWVHAGIDLDETSRWRAFGFVTHADAAPWVALGLVPATAGSWAGAQFTASEAAGWIERSGKTGSSPRVLSWARRQRSLLAVDDTAADYEKRLFTERHGSSTGTA